MSKVSEFKFLVGHIDTRHGERRVYNIDVGNLPVVDLEYFDRELTALMGVPVQRYGYISSRGLTNE